MNFESIFFDISDFQISKLLSKGSFANYYIVKDQNDGSKFVSKIYLNEGQCTFLDQIDVLKEVDILYKLQHPCIINFYGVNFQSFFDPTQIKPSIILEYFPNGSLRKIIDDEKCGKSPTSWNLTKKYINLLGISHAMKYIHKEGILHRNLKPENILLDSNYYPIISDFLLSQKFPQPLTKSIQIPLQKAVGTPLYMAPELTLEDEFYGIGVDVFAFAMIAYEILTKKMPGYETGLNFSILIIDRPFYRPHFDQNCVTPKMKDLLRQCLNSCQDERPSFDEIYEKLSTDFSYFFGEFDKGEIDRYIKNLEGQNSEDSNDCLIEEEDNDNYQVVCELKKGMKSESFKVVDKRNQKIIFKKILKFENEKFENFSNEFKNIHSINHPCICQAIGFNSQENIEIEPNKFVSTISLFFEYAEFSLKDCLNFSIISNTLKIRIIVEILHGLMYLHKKGIIFGNLNIDCILLNSVFDVKIKNKFIENSLRKDQKNELKFEHEKFFISPEILKNQSYDNKVDVYSFGVIVYYIVFGKPERFLSSEFLASITNSSIPQCCIDLIAKCTSINPNDRPSFEDILNYIRENNYQLLYNVDLTIISQRDQDLKK